jgi:hypothetical protein
VVEIMAKSSDQDVEIFLIRADMFEGEFAFETLIDELNESVATMVK